MKAFKNKPLNAFETPLPKEPALLVAASPYLSATHKFDSNVIFEQGRRYGFLGRLYPHAIVLDNNFLCTPHTLKGWTFIPQEGCTILSTLHAYLLQTNPQTAQQAMLTISNALIQKRW